jgi:hypothetical protein
MKRTLFWDVVFTYALQDHTVSIFSAEEWVSSEGWYPGLYSYHFSHTELTLLFSLGVLLDGEDGN